MAYNQYNYLLTVKDVLDTYHQHKQEGVSTMHVYRTYIFPKYFISRATFYTYMGIPVNKMLKELEEKRSTRQQSSRSVSAPALQVA